MNKQFIKSGKHIFFILLGVFIATVSQAQSIYSAIVNTSGNTFAKDGIFYEWSIGEVVIIETMINGSVSITNGLLQPVIPYQIITDGFLLTPNNILTANGDGKNDVWVIKDIEKYPDNEVTVFDRAGRVVFTAKNYQNDWRGYLSGFPLSEDTYYYIIKLKKGTQNGLLKGFITIINN